MYAAGKLKGEDVRDQVARDLRRMREAFQASVAKGEEGRAAIAEARVADLEAELQKIAASTARRSQGVASHPEPKNSR